VPFGRLGSSIGGLKVASSRSLGVCFNAGTSKAWYTKSNIRGGAWSTPLLRANWHLTALGPY
jgi:hypothetical protein